MRSSCWCVCCGAALPHCCRDGRVWDNNNNKDFHSPVEAAATSDSMVEMVFQVTRGAAGAEWAGRWGGGGAGAVSSLSSSPPGTDIFAFPVDMTCPGQQAALVLPLPPC
jgi:hypothetical protein